ncbi:MAG: hypothetical protein E4H21_04235 [Thermodesulfobacteriales bacterium]|jgi:hypothetical protein|nr:MAG: hypothetical protein E4H21_04235 [Thermodesulfobacteriales bacterium]
MTRLIYAALLVLFLASMTFAETPEAEAPKADAPKAETPKAEAPKAEAPTEETSDCDEILAQLEEAKSKYNTDYRAKGKAFNNWRKYNKELHSMSYEATDEPLADSAEKCEKGDYLGKDFCKGALEEFNKISAKEKPAKEELDAAEAKSKESKISYNILLRQSYEMNCLVKK